MLEVRHRNPENKILLQGKLHRFKVSLVLTRPCTSQQELNLGGIWQMTYRDVVVYIQLKPFEMDTVARLVCVVLHLWNL